MNLQTGVLQRFTYRRNSQNNILRFFVPQYAPILGSDGSTTYYLPTGLGRTGLAQGNIDKLYYLLSNATTPVQITPATGVLGTWSSGGFIKIADGTVPGWYELGLPNAMFVAPAVVKSVILSLQWKASVVDAQACNFQIDFCRSMAY